MLLDGLEVFLGVNVTSRNSSNSKMAGGSHSPFHAFLGGWKGLGQLGGKYLLTRIFKECNKHIIASCSISRGYGFSKT